MKDIKKETLEKIKNDKVTIRSRNYFTFLKIAAYTASTILLITSIFIFNLIFYLPNRTLRMVEGGSFSDYLSLFPWPLIILGALVVGSLIYIYRHYEGGYKRELGITALVVFAIVILGGIAAMKFKLNEQIEDLTPLHNFYEWNEDNFVPRGPRNRLRDPRLELNFRPGLSHEL